MTVLNQDFTLYTGSTLAIEVTVLDSEGAPIDFGLIPYMAKWVLYTADEVLITKTSAVGGGITFPAPTEGVMLITINAEDTVDLTSGIYGHEARLTVVSSGETSPVMAGLATVEESQSD
jgi:hypothetical protein